MKRVLYFSAKCFEEAKPHAALAPTMPNLASSKQRVSTPGTPGGSFGTNGSITSHSLFANRTAPFSIPCDWKASITVH